MKGTVFGYKNQIIFVVLLSLVARGQAFFNPMYSIDGYRTADLRTADASIGFIVSQGRFGLAALWWATDRLGFFGIDIGVASAILGTLFFSLAAVFLGSLLRPALDRTAMLIFVSCFVLHPYLTEFNHFSDVTFEFAIATLIAAIGSVLFLGSTVGIVSGLIATVIALSIYQTSIAFVLSIWLLRAAVSEPTSDKLIHRVWLRFKGMLLSIAGIALYSIVVRIIAALSGIPLDARTSPTSMLSVGDKLHTLGQALRLAFSPAASLLSPFTIALIAAMLILCLITIASFRRRTAGFAGVLDMIVWVGASLVIAAGLTSAGGLVWIVARTLTPIAAFEAAVFALGWQVATTRSKRVFAAAFALVLVGFVGGSNRILRDQWRVNMGDALQTNRFIGRLELLPGFRNLRTIVVSGTNTGRVFTATTWGDMNVPALGVEESQLGLIEETTGYHFAPPNTADKSAAASYCKTAASWPDPTSVAILGDVGVLCLRE